MSKKTQTVLVTGASGNIGGGAALALAQRGASVVLLGRNHEALESRANSIRSTLSNAHPNLDQNAIDTLVVDFTNLESVRRAADEALDRYASIDGVVLSVGRLVQHGPHLLPNGHELMFATSVIGPFLFTYQLLDRLERSNGLVIQVIAPFHASIDWNDVESIEKHKTIKAYNRVKTCERLLLGEFSRKFAGRVSFIAFDPSFVIDKTDPELKKRWPRGLMGLCWWIFASVAAKPPSVAGEPLADIILSAQPRALLNGALYKLNRKVDKPDKAMHDRASGERLWNKLTGICEISEPAP